MAEFVPPLVAFRRRALMSQATLAGRLGVTPGHMSRVERFGTASLPLALQLARITGLPVEAFAPGPRPANA